jgi:hypothetical protein
MSALLLLLLLGQAREPEEKVRVIVIPRDGPPMPAPVFDAGAPAPPVIIEQVPPPQPVQPAQPAPVPVPQPPQPQPVQPAPPIQQAPPPGPLQPIQPVPPPPQQQQYEPQQQPYGPPQPQQPGPPPQYVGPPPPGPQQPPVLEGVDAGTPGGLAVRVGIESGFTSWPSGNPQDLYFDLRPLLSVQSGDIFALDIAPMFHLLLLDDAPNDRDSAYGGLLRRNDWDEPSDFGQIIRSLRIGKLDGPVWLRAGAVQLKTLGLGHLINRYSNQDNPEYHPASGSGGLRIGAVRAEFFASDIFGARIFSGLAGVEFGRILSSDPDWYDRLWLTAEVAHDVGRANGITPSVTLLHTDASVLVYRSKLARVQIFAGLGGRILQNANWGAVGGLSTDVEVNTLQLAGKLEIRKQAGGFRQGFFGPQYEISRFVGTGFSGLPISEEILPDSYSVYGEVRGGIRGFIVAEGAIEHFAFGRTDVDLSVNAEMFSSHFVTSARFTAIGVGTPLSRYFLYCDARFRIFKSFYALASGGTLFFPQPLGTLTRGVFISAGAGVDFETIL